MIGQKALDRVQRLGPRPRRRRGRCRSSRARPSARPSSSASTSSPIAASDHGRAGQRDRRVLAHDHEVAHRAVQRSVAERRPEHRGHARDRRDSRRATAGTCAKSNGHAREAPAEQIRQAAAVVVGQADQRHGLRCRPTRDPVLLAHVHRAGGAGEHGRVDGDDRHVAAVDPRKPGDDRRRRS